MAAQKIIYKKREITDEKGSRAGVTQGAVDIHDKHVHAKLFNAHVRRSLGPAYKRGIASTISAGDYQVHIQDAETVFSEGDKFELCEGIMPPNMICEADVLKAVSISTNGSNIITIDRPVDNDYTTAGYAQGVSLDMQSVAGSVSSPVRYVYMPREAVHISSLVFFMKTMLAPKDSLFGDIDALTNGVILKVFRSSGDIETPFIPIRSNLALKASGFDVRYGSLGVGLSGTVVAVKDLLGQEGAVIELLAGDYISLSVQDDLTELMGLEGKVGGHIIGEHE